MFEPALTSAFSGIMQPFGVDLYYFDRKENDKMEEIGVDLVKDLDEFLGKCDVVRLRLRRTCSLTFSQSLLWNSDSRAGVFMQRMTANFSRSCCGVQSSVFAHFWSPLQSPTTAPPERRSLQTASGARTGHHQPAAAVESPGAD